MSIKKYLGAALCASAMFSLTACGGGGNSSNHDADANPSTSPVIKLRMPELPPEGYLALEEGDVARLFLLDTQYKGASGTTLFGTDVLEWVSPESDHFDSGFMFSQKNPKKFVLTYTDNFIPTQSITYGCRSSAWSAEEMTALTKAFGNTDFPICDGSVVIDPTTHHMQFVGIKLQSKDPTSAAVDTASLVIISANFGWVLQDNIPVPDETCTKTDDHTHTCVSSGGSTSSASNP